MPIQIPTTQEIIDRNIANFVEKLGQEIPITDKAFLRVLATIEAGMQTALYKYAVWANLQNLALTATGDDLEEIGEEHDVFKNPALKFKGVASADPFGTGTVTAGTVFIGQSNGERYTVDSDAPFTASEPPTINLTAEVSGIDANLLVGDQLSSEHEIVNLQGGLTFITSVTQEGEEREEEEAYRRRVLNEIRTVGGGGNGVDYRTWAEAVSGVNRAFPYSGAPINRQVDTWQDGDMEDPSTSAWSTGTNTSVAKDTSSPYQGDRSLQVFSTVGGWDEPTYVFQVGTLTVGKAYRITGFARNKTGGGTLFPRIWNESNRILWRGSSATSWQSFSVDFVAIAQNIWLGYDGLADSTGVNFDLVQINEISVPGDRTVYVEATISGSNPDGIPSTLLLDAVRDAINTDPDTGLARPCLGDTDENLFVEPITRPGFYVEIRNLLVQSSQEDQVKTSVESALTEYLLSVGMYVEGVDPEVSRNDTITNYTVSTIVQDIFNVFGASASSVGFGKTPTEFLGSYQLQQGELAKLASINWVND
jgi:uncharacterized phage protein gp47/JayE